MRHKVYQKKEKTSTSVNVSVLLQKLNAPARIGATATAFPPPCLPLSSPILDQSKAPVTLHGGLAIQLRQTTTMSSAVPVSALPPAVRPRGRPPAMPAANNVQPPYAHRTRSRDCLCAISNVGMQWCRCRWRRWFSNQSSRSRGGRARSSRSRPVRRPLHRLPRCRLLKWTRTCRASLKSRSRHRRSPMSSGRRPWRASAPPPLIYGQSRRCTSMAQCRTVCSSGRRTLTCACSRTRVASRCRGIASWPPMPSSASPNK